MMTSVLVLNATYEPISFTRLQRAVSLVLSGDAVIEEAHPELMLRSAGATLPWPRVLRLLRYVKVPFVTGPATWSKSGVMKRDKHRCGYCPHEASTVDHVVPTSRGGGDKDWFNTVAACWRCNNKKDNMTPEEAGMTLQHKMWAPSRKELSLMSVY